jgi:hypothetical protein
VKEEIGEEDDDVMILEEDEEEVARKVEEERRVEKAKTVAMGWRSKFALNGGTAMASTVSLSMLLYNPCKGDADLVVYT